MSGKRPSIRNLISNLTSNKIKERRAAVEQIEKRFETQRAFENISEEKLEALYVGIFASFEKELRAAKGKDGRITTASAGAPAQALIRMGDLSRLVRSLATQGVCRMRSSTARMVLDQMLKFVKYRGQLIQNVSLNFIKAMVGIMNWKPQRNRLYNDLWVTLVEFSFNVALQCPLSTRLDPGNEEENAEEEEEEGVFTDVSAGSDEDQDSTDIGQPHIEPATRKRPYTESPPREQLSRQSSAARGDSPKVGTVDTASLEQVEAMRLLCILLTSPSPILSSSMPFLPAAILQRLGCLLEKRYGSSMQIDLLAALPDVLSHLTLNKHHLVVKFAYEAWSDLVGLWGTLKDQTTKEHLVIILHMLFPYYTAEIERGKNKQRSRGQFVPDGVAMLWEALRPTESRKGVAGISLESLRLRLRHNSDENCAAFVTDTFQHGWNFDEEQALAWTILELQADCAKELYQFSEAIHPTGHRETKRVKLENPINEILHAIVQQNPDIRIYYLQVLLFFVDRHWSTLHTALQAEVVHTVLKFLSSEDASVQVWCFMCFAAIAHASVTKGSVTPVLSLPSSSTDNGPWDGIWAHAMRRSNIPTVCRAACHAAHVLLHYAGALLSPQRMLGEIEAFAKDLSVQGPSFPYDSVCSLMVTCMRVSNQDVRLYRMSFEEKALTWLTDSWRPDSGTRKRLPLHTVQDILGLLHSMCGVSKSPELLCEMQLPDSIIITAIIEEHATAVIRDFQLDAHLPPFRKSTCSELNSAGQDTDSLSQWDPLVSTSITPSERERRISAYFLKTLDELFVHWKAPKDFFGRFTVEMVRAALDLSVIALAFEASLMLNGTEMNRRTIQAACKILTLLAVEMVAPRWTTTEQALIISAFEPLILEEPMEADIPPWETLLPPEEGSGIRTEVLRSLSCSHHSGCRNQAATRRALQRAILHSSDVQNAVIIVMQQMRSYLQLVADQSFHDDLVIGVADEPVNLISQQELSGLTFSRTVTRAVGICISSLAIFPVLQSASGEPTRDQELLDILLCDEPETLLLLLPSYLRNVRRGTLGMTQSSFKAFVTWFGKLLHKYAYVRDPRMNAVIIQFLSSTMDIWLAETIQGSKVGKSVLRLCDWFVEKIFESDELTTPWHIRDYFLRFLDQYLAADPEQRGWSTNHELPLPSELLPEMGADDDVRVRLRAAVSNARMLRFAHAFGQTSDVLYTAVHSHLTTSLPQYEEMLTRMICLGNMMIVSSAVRRGPYWHLLEACIHTPIYNRHVETILDGVAIRLGLPSLAALFGLYAGQIAYSVREAGRNLTDFPPRVLGYRDLKTCLEAAFTAFSPFNLLGGSTPSSEAHGHHSFKAHCSLLQKTVAEGLQECFADIIGYNVVSFVRDNPYMDDDRSGSLFGLIDTTAQEAGVEHKGLSEYLRQEAVGIVVAIIRTLEEQDISANGSIISALNELVPEATEVFMALTEHRALHSCRTHQPNLPRAPPAIILRALNWFHEQVPIHDDPAVTYHVLHRLFAELERSPLVNEQMRLLNVICLWTACHEGHFSNKEHGETLLYTLSRSAANLLPQFDLVHGAQSILQWALTRIRKDTALAELLIRIACSAHDLSTNTDDEFSRVGDDLMQWTETTVHALSQRTRLQSSIQQAISAWPTTLPGSLQDISHEPDGEELSKVLADRSIMSNKFRLVKQLRQLASDGLYSESRFAKSDFWRLKEFIPSAQHLSINDIDYFSQLLLLQRGSIDGLDCDYNSSQTMLEMHLVEAEHQAVADPTVPPQRAIMETLLSNLNAPSAAKVHLAFITLRSILSIRNPAPGGSRRWASSHEAQLLLLKSYAQPLSARLRANPQNVLRFEESTELAQDFPQWIRYVTTTLSAYLAIKNPFYQSLTYILQADTDFAEEVLPLLAHTLLRLDMGQGGRADRQILSGYFSSILSSELSSTACRRAVINTVLHLRRFQPSSGNHIDPLGYDKWLQIDFVLLSRNATLCGAYTTALLFTELAVEHGHETIRDKSNVEQILYDIYDRIDEPDGFYGIQSKDLHQFLLKSFHHEQQWDKAFRFHGAALETSNTTSADLEGLLQSMHSFGFDRLAMTTMQSAPGIDNQLSSSSMTYSLGWRTDTWDLPERSQSRNAGASLYLALRAINRERDSKAIDAAVENAIAEEAQALRSIGNENLTEIRRVIQNLVCLEQVHRWRSPDIQACLQTRTLQDTYWEVFPGIDERMDFSNVEAIMATRIALLRSVRRQEQREQIGDLLTPFASELVNLESRNLLNLSKAARSAGRGQIALNAVVQAQRLRNPSPDFDVFHEFASVLWMTNEPTSALQFLKNALPHLDAVATTDEAETVRKKALVYALLGNWASEACLEKPAVIKSEFFDTAASLVHSLLEMQRGGPDSIPASVYHDYAIFAERQYHATVKSPDSLRWKILVDRKTTEVKTYEERQNQLARNSVERELIAHELKRSKQILEEDIGQYDAYHRTRDAFLECAIEMHSLSLAASDQFDVGSAIRLCSLWFANFDYLENDFQAKVSTALLRVPSQKFVFLAHQLSARLSNPQTSSSAVTAGYAHNVYGLMLRMCREHPFHCLYSVYCLKADRSRSKRRASTVTRHDPSPAQAERSAAAVAIFDYLRNGDPKDASRANAVEHLSDASLEWAQYPIKALVKNTSSDILVPANLAISKLRDIKVPVITAHTPLDPTGRYENCVWIRRFEQRYTTAGGVNVPKILSCIGSDGQKYKQLYKGEGEDDLRQDAVMEQVFQLVNEVLRRDRETLKRNLHVRTYRVIPLASQAGVIEFVVDTTPLQHWITKAHEIYAPPPKGKYDRATKVIAAMDDARKTKSDEARIALFQEVCKQWKPVMRHYFTEKHKIPMPWFRMRLHYARSVATTSIVGHILGLGDRHLSNILIHNPSGEVVHIDLGIAFEQGRYLRVPERVPFRLTPDMVDGLGSSGTNGVFKRCAEETLRVLRDGSEVILTVLEVFKYDPLHSWTVSEQKMKQVQSATSEVPSGTADPNPLELEAVRLVAGVDMSAGVADEAADRALSSVTRKLDKGLSVQFTVNELIAEATDPANLGLMFFGWTQWC